MKNPLRQLLLLPCLLAVALGATAEETDLNPIDGSVHTTERWETYEPQGGRRTCAEKVCLESVRLLQEETVIASRTSVDALTGLIEASVISANWVLATQTGPFHLLVQYTCEPGNQAVELAYQGEVDETALQRLHEALSAIPPIVVSDTVSFQISLRVANTSAEAAEDSGG